MVDLLVSIGKFLERYSNQQLYRFKPYSGMFLEGTGKLDGLLGIVPFAHISSLFDPVDHLLGSDSGLCGVGKVMGAPQDLLVPRVHIERLQLVLVQRLRVTIYRWPIIRIILTSLISN